MVGAGLGRGESDRLGTVARAPSNLEPGRETRRMAVREARTPIGHGLVAGLRLPGYAPTPQRHTAQNERCQ